MDNSDLEGRFQTVMLPHKKANSGEAKDIFSHLEDVKGVKFQLSVTTRS